MSDNPKRPLLTRLVTAIALIFCATLALATLLTFGAPATVLSIWMLHAIDLGIALLILAGATGIGLRVNSLLKISAQAPAERLVFGAGIGLGIFAIVTLALGLAGFLQSWLLWILLIAAIFSSATSLRALRKDLFEAARGQRPIGLALWGVIGIFFLFYLCAAFLPPHMYDVLEYHLAAPAAFHQAGKIYFLDHNVYANFPQNVETIYLLGMSLDGTRDGGATVGKIIFCIVGLLAVVGVRSLGKRLFSETAGNAAAAIFYVWPGVAAFSSVEYVELPLIFYTVLTVLAAVRAFDVSQKWWPWISLSGFSAGPAIGCKYTAVLLVVLPVAIGLLLKKRSVPVLITFLVAAGIAISPWLIKNYAYTGDPVYPLMGKYIGNGHWTPEQDASWMQAHSPPKGENEPNLVQRGWEFLAAGEHSDCLLYILIPLALAGDRRTRKVAFIFLLFAALDICLWYRFTQRIDRFLAPVVPFLALLSGAGIAVAAERRAALAWGALFILLFVSPMRRINYGVFYSSVDLALGWTTPNAFLADSKQSEFAPVYPAMEYISQLPANTRILFLGEARPYYCDRQTVSATVFDSQPLAEIFAPVMEGDTDSTLMQRFRARGITHILVNTSELARLQHTYSFQYSDLGTGKTETRLGMLNGLDWRLFAQFTERHLRMIYPTNWPEDRKFDWSKWDEYRKLAVKQSQDGKGYPGFVAVYEIY